MSDPFNARVAGILLHPTSLPGPFGIGDLGAGARRFVDWLADAGIGLWQILPLVPPGPGESPYASISALAGNPWLIDLEGLADAGLLDRAALAPPGFPLDAVDAKAMKAFKGPLLERAADALWRGANAELRAELAAFRRDQPWVEDTATFVALKAANDGRAWWDWPEGLKDREPAALAEARETHARAIDRYVALQFLFDHQWRALRALCAERHVAICGDVPIYVDRDSVDVWANRSQFRLDADGAPLGLSGVPPDYFSETGQLWGNPIYDWDRMAEDGHAWWVRRLRRATQLVDYIRLDHFRGFAAYWEVPPGAADARGGKWVDGPGMRLFDDLAKALGGLPLIAEDLGVIDDRVVALRDGVGVPGMRVLQFAFGAGANHDYLPHNYVEDSVAYTATHDNDTTFGWWQETAPHIRDHVRRYLAVNGHDVVWDMIRAVMQSVARVAVVPLQDVLGLDGRSRMNTPGTTYGNWAWRVREQAFNGSLSGRLRELTDLYGRTPSR